MREKTWLDTDAKLHTFTFSTFYVFPFSEPAVDLLTNPEVMSQIDNLAEELEKRKASKLK